jgi:carbamoyl-phosphate synthase large subunit
MDKKVVLVTGIGGNVGQGILRNIIASKYDITLIGCNTIEFSAGNHFCSKTYQVPFAFDSDYIPCINTIVRENKVDLVIPSTDYEIYYLAKNKSNVLCEVAVSGTKAAEIYLDKYKSFLHHKKNNIPFAASVVPGEYKGQFRECIAKPREGRGSRGLVVNPEKWDEFPDDKYMIQELHRGKEITTAFYVDKNRNLHGYITLERSLENGTTSQCHVNKAFDKEIEPILNKIIECSDVAGAANLQSIVTDKNEIYPFEINCRISGTNSIRSNFGFKDVEYTLQEYLYGLPPDQPILTEGKAIRILMDIIYPGDGSNGSFIF